MNRNSAPTYIPGCIHVCHVSYYESMSYDLVSKYASQFIVEGRQPRCTSSHELSIRDVMTSDFDADDVFEAVAPLKQMQLRCVLLPYRSPSAKDTRLRELKRSPFSNISGNGVRLNGIATRGNEGFLAISRRLIFSSRKRRNRTSRLPC
jgi:hypothetical protein